MIFLRESSLTRSCNGTFPNLQGLVGSRNISRVSSGTSYMCMIAFFAIFVSPFFSFFFLYTYLATDVS